MQSTHAHMRAPAWLMYISGMLHLAVVVMSGLNPETFPLAGAGVFWLVFGYILLATGSRFLAWIGFFLAMAGMIAALSGGAGLHLVAAWMGLGIALVDGLAAASLFVVLWRDRPAATPTN